MSASKPVELHCPIYKITIQGFQLIPSKSYDDIREDAITAIKADPQFPLNGSTEIELYDIFGEPLKDYKNHVRTVMYHNLIRIMATVGRERYRPKCDPMVQLCWESMDYPGKQLVDLSPKQRYDEMRQQRLVCSGVGHNYIRLISGYRDVELRFNNVNSADAPRPLLTQQITENWGPEALEQLTDKDLGIGEIDDVEVLHAIYIMSSATCGQLLPMRDKLRDALLAKNGEGLNPTDVAQVLIRMYAEIGEVQSHA